MFRSLPAGSVGVLAVAAVAASVAALAAGQGAPAVEADGAGNLLFSLPTGSNRAYLLRGDEAAAVAGPSSLARAEVPQLLLGLQPPNQTSPRQREARQAAASLWWRDPARRGLPAGGTFAL